MSEFNVGVCKDNEVIKEIFKEYSQIKGAESCFVSFDKELGFKEVTFTTKPEVMKVGYELYKRMGFEEVGEKDGIVSMRMGL